MKKRFIVFFLLCALLLSFSALAEGAGVIDGAGKLSSDESAELEGLLQDMLFSDEFQIVLVTVTGENIDDYVSYADDMYDFGGYIEDGMLFLIDVDERVWYVSTAGRGIYAFSDEVIDEVMDDVLYWLSEDDYYTAFRQFIESSQYRLSEYDSGSYTPDEDDYWGDDGDYEPGSSTGFYFIAPLFLMSLGLGLIVALIVTLTMRKKMRSVRPQRSAADYTVNGSLRVTESQDVFLYHTVTRTEKPKDNNSGSFGGGVHSGSSGSSHGGHGGRF
ncbi:MAG: TPM domain-containing protein [Oscillospiraceae bacterium]|nr:TPM domain-containing protein [Oscillospiraceae bacterium]